MPRNEEKPKPDTAGPPSIPDAKREARALRADLEAVGIRIGHSQALERLAWRYGFRDWNTFVAAAGKRPARAWVRDGRVRGHYLSQPFEARIVSAEPVDEGRFRLELDLDRAVDVVTFDSFSAFRKRIRGVVGPDGRTRERTSNGRPHIELELGPS